MKCCICEQEVKGLIEDHDYCPECWAVAYRMAAIGMRTEDPEKVRAMIKKIRLDEIAYRKRKELEPDEPDIIETIGRRLRGLLDGLIERVRS